MEEEEEEEGHASLHGAGPASALGCIPFVLQAQSHRVVWLGRDLIDRLVPTPCHGLGPLPPAQGAQSPIQPGLEHCQGGGSHSLSGQPVPGPHHPSSRGHLVPVSPDCHTHLLELLL